MDFLCHWYISNSKYDVSSQQKFAGRKVVIMLELFSISEIAFFDSSNTN